MRGLSLAGGQVAFASGFPAKAPKYRKPPPVAQKLLSEIFAFHPQMQGFASRASRLMSLVQRC